MKQGFLKASGYVAFLVIFTAAFAQIEARAQDLKQEETVKVDEPMIEKLWGNGARGLEGSWLAQTTTRNCQTGTVMENFSKLTSFHMGGTANETSSSTLFRSTAFGIWEHNGGDSFRYLLRFFRFNPDGTTSGSVRAIWTVTLDAFSDSYTATAQVQIIAPNGTVVANICGNETATRIAFEN